MANQLRIDIVGFSNGEVYDGIGFVAYDEYGEAFELEYDADTFYEAYPDEDTVIEKVLTMPPFEDYIASMDIEGGEDYDPHETIVVTNYGNPDIRRR